jgi:hypothetical protein
MQQAEATDHGQYSLAHPDVDSTKASKPQDERNEEE